MKNAKAEKAAFMLQLETQIYWLERAMARARAETKADNDNGNADP